jgi:hypothetical protein
MDDQTRFDVRVDGAHVELKMHEANLSVDWPAVTHLVNAAYVIVVLLAILVVLAAVAVF